MLLSSTFRFVINHQTYITRLLLARCCVPCPTASHRAAGSTLGPQVTRAVNRRSCSGWFTLQKKKQCFGSREPEAWPACYPLLITSALTLASHVKFCRCWGRNGNPSVARGVRRLVRKSVQIKASQWSTRLRVLQAAGYAIGGSEGKRSQEIRDHIMFGSVT